ncbi:hypothetical protein RYX36_014186 [Vicia faba]
MNNQGVHHELIFNRLELHPIIISGWPCMESYYNLPSEVVQTVGYYGNDNYGMLSFKEVVRPLDLLCFHSRYVLHKEIYVFDITLSPFSIDLPKLVELSFSWLF